MENVTMKNRLVKAGQRPFRVSHDKELMACPFCADSPVLLHLDIDWIVHCPSCDCIIARQFTSDGVLALEMAFRRTDNPTVKRVISKLAKEVVSTKKEDDHFELEVRVK